MKTRARSCASVLLHVCSNLICQICVSARLRVRFESRVRVVECRPSGAGAGVLLCDRCECHKPHFGSASASDHMHYGVRTCVLYENVIYPFWGCVGGQAIGVEQFRTMRTQYTNYFVRTCVVLKITYPTGTSLHNHTLTQSRAHRNRTRLRLRARQFCEPTLALADSYWRNRSALVGERTRTERAKLAEVRTPPAAAEAFFPAMHVRARSSGKRESSR